MKCFAISLGCPKNRVDTERLLGSLSSAECELLIVDDITDADLVFINTCAFIEPAVSETVRTIVAAIEDINNMPVRPFLAVAGCLNGRYNVQELASELPEVNLWLEPNALDDWAFLLCQNLRIPFPQEQGRLVSTLPSYAWLKIGEGCKHNCAFCTIPSIRGKHQSLPLDFLYKEARSMVSQGVKEIILVAQDVTSWNESDEKAKGDIRPLLDSLLKIDDLARIRLMYLYPSGLTDELLTYISQTDKRLLPYFDVPLQHAHPDTLYSMGRPFSANPYEVVERIRKHIPAAALRTSLIVGYPNEEEEHFQALYKFVEEVRFHNLGVFSYHAEEGTKAATFKNQVEEHVKEERRNAIMELQADISEEILTTYLGSSLEILVDAEQGDWDGLYTGRAWFQAPEVDGVTYISGDKIHTGDFVLADIIETKEYDMVALA